QVLATGSEASSTGSSVDTGGMSSGQHGLRAEAPLPSFLDVAKEMQTHTELEWEREGNVSTLIPHQIERLETTRVTMTIPGENTLLSYGKKLKGECDPGITMRTDHHVQIQVSEAPTTSVLMGGPSTHSKAVEFQDWRARASEGYSMSTDGH